MIRCQESSSPCQTISREKILSEENFIIFHFTLLSPSRISIDRRSLTTRRIERSSTAISLTFTGRERTADRINPKTSPHSKPVPGNPLCRNPAHSLKPSGLMCRPTDGTFSLESVRKG